MKASFMKKISGRHRISLLAIPFLQLAAVLLSGSLRAVPSPEAPSLSVHESAYGTITREGHRENIDHLDLKIVSHSATGVPIRVECFFFKPGKHGGTPSVDDAVGFEITDPHGTYRVEAKPIPLKGEAKPSKVGKASKKAHPSATGKASPQAPSPRAGYMVLISRNGTRLREVFSDHVVETFAREHPDLLANARIRILPSPPLAGR